MKKITSLIVFFISVVGFAQITYDSTDFALPTDTYLVSKSSTGINGFDFVQTGANYTWDYTTLPVATQSDITWMDPNDSSYKTSWCLSNSYVFNCNTEFNNTFNLAKQVAEGIELQGFGLTDVVNHYEITPTEISNKMFGAVVSAGGISLPMTIDYTMPDVIYHFPINYNDTYTGNSQFQVDLNSLGLPINYSSETTRTNTVEGWGMLTTPFGVFNNVLKMKTVEVIETTILTESETIETTRTVISYKWFDKNYGIPVLEAEGEEVADVWAATNITYIDNEQCLEPGALFGYFPIVPEYDYVENFTTVSFLNQSSNYDSVLWDFGDGNTSVEDEPNYNFLCPGTHLVILTVTNDFCDPDQTDSITFPVVISDSNDEFTTNVTLTSTSLIADRDYTTTSYQWLDCNNGNSPITGETNQTFIPTEEGDYAVELITNGCQSISDCYTFNALGVDEFNDTKFIIYPNPTKGLLHVSIPNSSELKSVQVYNTLGQVITENLDIAIQPKGIYYVKIETENRMVWKKVIKK